MNKKQLFTLAFGITAVMNMNANIDNNTTAEETAIVALAAVITTESALPKDTEETIAATDVQDASSTEEISTSDVQVTTPVEAINAETVVTTLEIAVSTAPEVSSEEAQK
ncbi:hypothetical protein KBC04_02235 [Candidatus Babeliales bacterium]|nr:hypothetical protein [Candidatus Babeliales bacterium]MBP9843773.1 hypothetical protein [Candidatus Babeliales bacterium]